MKLHQFHVKTNRFFFFNLIYCLSICYIKIFLWKKTSAIPKKSALHNPNAAFNFTAIHRPYSHQRGDLVVKKIVPSSSEDEKKITWSSSFLYGRNRGCQRLKYLYIREIAWRPLKRALNIQETEKYFIHRRARFLLTRRWEQNWQGILKKEIIFCRP